jgi:biopolymer transport protein ExbB/TolQ/biopolymer transport protein ExbD
MVMAAISWIVMLAKAAYIGRVSRANANFLDRFDDAGSDVPRFAGLAANDPGDLDRSVLYHIFEAGHEELVRRSAANQIGRLALTPQAIATLRASLDRVAAYEGQRLNSMMVLLTIAISGGPFLGLLGTVVGVMITFAAIAATGDVNINAIAPGIAAALVATIAGLGVAIPALFGYNLLITRIKDLTTVQSDSKAYDDINITPMLDLAYVLLVIFIIMTTASVQGIRVDLPKASDTPSLAQPKTKAITITNDGKIFLDTYPVTLQELEQRLVQQRGVDPDTHYVIKGDGQVQYQAVVDVLALMGQHDITKLGLVTQRLVK